MKNKITVTVEGREFSIELKGKGEFRYAYAYDQFGGLVYCGTCIFATPTVSSVEEAIKIAKRWCKKHAPFSLISFKEEAEQQEIRSANEFQYAAAMR